MDRIHPRQQQAQGLHGLGRQGQRQASCRADDPRARGHDARRRGELAENWAKLGYVSFAADIFGYGEGILPKDVPEMTAQTAIYSKDRALMRARTQAGFDALVKNPMVDAAKIALIGYCFGGTVGVEFGSTGAPLVANVAIHGSFRDHAPGWAKNVKGKFLILHGAEDEPYPLAGGRQGGPGAARSEGPVPAGGLQRRRPRLLQPRRTRPRSAPTSSRSPRWRERSRSCSAGEGVQRSLTAKHAMPAKEGKASPPRPRRAPRKQ